jgi:hypothetical protein
VLRGWRDRRLPDLLAEHGLSGAAEDAFPNDGWSGSRLTRLRGLDGSLILKRTSWSTDWIVRATDDRSLREAWFATAPLAMPPGILRPHLGAARDGDGAAILMPDLSRDLISWAEGAPAIAADTLDVVLRRMATLHEGAWWSAEHAPPWCPLDRRLALLTRPSAEAYRAQGLAVGQRFVDGWDAFDRSAPPAARRLIVDLAADITPLVTALVQLPAVGLHGDLKLANVAIHAGGEVSLIDWQMTLRAPVAVELGWFLVSNVAQLPGPPHEVLGRYRTAVVPDAAWDTQVDLAWIVGLLLRGWRKGLDAEAGVATGWGAAGKADLAEWCDRAVEAAARRL